MEVLKNIWRKRHKGLGSQIRSRALGLSFIPAMVFQQRVPEIHRRPRHTGLGLGFRVSGVRNQSTVAQIQGKGIIRSSSLWVCPSRNCIHEFFPERYSGQRQKKGLGSTKIRSRALGLRIEAIVGVAMAVGVAAAVLLVFCFAFGLGILFHPLWLVRWIQKFQPHIVYHIPMKEKYVALTLDDGPQSNITPHLLDILRKYESKATWFIIGNHMNGCPRLVERIYDDGHEVGNHTMADVPSWRLSKKEFEDQLVEVDDCIKAYFRQDSSGRTLKWFRPGHGFYNSSIVNTCEKHGYQIALGSLYPMDHMFQNQAELLVKNMLWRMHPGAVIVLHDRAAQWKQTPQVLEMLLPELQRRGYKIVTLSELVQIGANEKGM